MTDPTDSPEPQPTSPKPGATTPTTTTSQPSAAPVRPPWWRHAVNGVVLVALLAVAGVVAHTAPTQAQWQGPIPVTGAIGDEIAGRNIVATVTGVRVADEVVAGNGWAGPTTGVWVVVDASVAASVDDEGALLGAARLQIGDTFFTASERPDLGTIAGQSLVTGIPVTGPLMFEIPRDLLDTDAAAHAELQLGLDDDVRVDSLLVVPVDLGALPVERSIETDYPERGPR